jgi:hypothetical protein
LKRALLLWHSGDAEDVLKLVVDLVCPIDGGSGQGVQECHCSGHVLVGPIDRRAWCLLVVDGNNDDPGRSSGLGEVDYRDPLRLECGIVAL